MNVEKDSTADADILENEDDKELDEILNGKIEEETKTENKNDEKTYKLGTQVFATFEEFNTAVQDMHSRNSKMASKIGELGYDPKTLTPRQKKEVEKAVEKEEEKKVESEKEFGEKDFYKFEAIRFQKSFPDSREYSEEISVLVKKDNCKINGEPSYALAFARALVANGQQIPDRLANVVRSERGDSSESSKESVKNQKKIMKSGGTSSVDTGQDTFKSEEDLASVSDFAKML